MDNNDFINIINQCNNPINNKNIDYEIKIDNDEISTIRFENIKSIKDKKIQFQELKSFLKDNFFKSEYISQLFPDEFYDAITSYMLGVKLKPHKQKDFFDIVDFKKIEKILYF